MSQLRRSAAVRAVLSVFLMALLVGSPVALGPSMQSNCTVPSASCGGG
ncbi:MAG: hypothetical protein M9928_05200 [Anaerolineae bacterium]|nr:hypothetical protein [Anaerolineae bacterium]MCO5194967.1 hypothetical protein [Anaerolineae bacterium]MCO5196305.1 hypothetical protein [Anaerolineae bacterium]MCO5204403.1 hypothetical protein [Anaerolineae bacterium]